MTKLPPAKQWMLSRMTKMESGEERIDAVDIDGVAIRACIGHIPGTHTFTQNDANCEHEEKKK